MPKLNPWKLSHRFLDYESRNVPVGRKSTQAVSVYLGHHKNNNTHLYRINGTADHLHILSSLHPSVCLADFVKDIKLGSSSWIKKERLFPKFSRWQEGYGAFTLSINEKGAVIKYIKNQQEHHRKTSFHDEFREMLETAGVEFDERYLL
jgi:REP-associated tyrosine transposase